MMKMSEDIGELAAALVAFQAAMEAVPKDDSNPFYNSKYAGLPTVVKAASPLLKDQNLAVTQWPSSRGDTLTLVTLLMHSSGQYMADETPLLITKEDSQGHGSAITYMRRYAYCAILGIVAEEDDDGNAASPKGTGREPVRATRRPPPTARANEDPGPVEPPLQEEELWDDPDAQAPIPLQQRAQRMAPKATVHPATGLVVAECEMCGANFERKASEGWKKVCTSCYRKTASRR